MRRWYHVGIASVLRRENAPMVILNFFAFGEDILTIWKAHNRVANNMMVAALMAIVQMIDRQGDRPYA